MLLGRDWPGFDRLLAAATQHVSPAGNRQRKKSRQRPRQRPVLLASDSARDGESPSQSTNLFYDVFQQVKGGGAFAKEQLGDERLKNCWTQGHECPGNSLVLGAPGLPLHRAPPGGDGQRQRRRTLADMGSFRRSVRVHPTPIPNLPLVSRGQDDA